MRQQQLPFRKNSANTTLNIQARVSASLVKELNEIRVKKNLSWPDIMTTVLLPYVEKERKRK